MKRLTDRPVLLGVLTGLFLLTLCIFVRIPIYDGILHYDHNLVHFQVESKVALSYYFGIGTDKIVLNGMMPSRIQLKPIGYVLFVLIHVGLPALISIRFKMSNARKVYTEVAEKEQGIETNSNE